MRKKNEGPVRTLAQMCAAGRYDCVNQDITRRHFRVRPELFTTEDCKVLHFGHTMTTAEVEAAIRVVGYEPAVIEQLLAYGAAHPDEQRQYPIVALGSTWVSDAERGLFYVPYLDMYVRGRHVRLYYVHPGYHQWGVYYRFLVSSKCRLAP